MRLQAAGAARPLEHRKVDVSGDVPFSGAGQHIFVGRMPPVSHQGARRKSNRLRARKAVVDGERVTGFQRGGDPRQPEKPFETALIPAAFFRRRPVFTKVCIQFPANRLAGVPLKPAVFVLDALFQNWPPRYTATCTGSASKNSFEKTTPRNLFGNSPASMSTGT